MLSEGLVVKLAVIPGAVVIAAEVVPHVVSDGFGGVAVIAAGLGGVGYLYRLIRRAHRSAHALVGRVQSGLDIIEETPARFDALEARVTEHGKALDLLAETDKYRIKDAVAGDDRSPVDRRRAA